MNFILYSDVNDYSISQSLGRPEYSYYFVLKAYRPVLESLGQVHVVASVAEVDPLYQTLRQAGQECLFLSFSPPHKTPTDLLCPMVCVVAWEFDSIPAEHWDGDLRHDWSRTLARHGRVITLSSHTAEAIRRSLGEDFPVLVLPTPLWERFAAIREQYPSAPVNPGTVLQIKGCIIDSRPLGLSADGLIAPLIEEEPVAEPDVPEAPAAHCRTAVTHMATSCIHQSTLPARNHPRLLRRERAGAALADQAQPIVLVSRSGSRPGTGACAHRGEQDPEGTRCAASAGRCRTTSTHTSCSTRTSSGGAAGHQPGRRNRGQWGGVRQRVQPR